jgi:hypothetical protein
MKPTNPKNSVFLIGSVVAALFVVIGLYLSSPSSFLGKKEGGSGPAMPAPALAIFPSTVEK